ncbi:MAG: HAD family hydrolase [Patescibacteria group bacterium]|nr:HAD family hydrolase [Patescibacteria group bacterium]
MRPKLILFDFSGTLAYLSKPVDFKRFFYSLKKFGIEITTEEEIKAFATFFADLLGWAKDWLDFSEKFFEEYGERPEREMIKKLARFLEKNVGFELYEDVKEIFNLPVQKAILSGNARFVIESLGLEKFARIFTPKETKFLKPDPRAFLIPLKKLKVKPKETIIVGDELERDLIPAKNLGMEAILIDRKNKIKKAPVKKINSLAELKQILGL